MRVYGLLGKSLSHSFSKRYFEEKFRTDNITDCKYENFELQSIDEFPQLLETHGSLAGLNVTIPYKTAIIPFLSNVSAVVEKLGACNCVRVESDRSLSGFNTDVAGFRNSLQRQLKTKPDAALILGTGGASKAVQFVLSELGIKWKLVSSKHQHILYEDVTDELIASHKLIVNTTPLGMYPRVGEKPPLPYNAITKDHFLFDLIYNPTETEFLKEGRGRGAVVSNGLEMLQIQAEESWRIWQEQ